ncbi:REM2- and Rab-like small GTPase 1-like [Scleropages formosus]|uniref:REM2-and Rab-like small GTPase 1-like n=1 Tax=Scleropages formosus TaxID=113540 RepID=A0A0P7UDT9_SCLFO|nr:REM2- and Rab-like small GTPase 1-like [Scleropages formosus]
MLGAACSWPPTCCELMARSLRPGSLVHVDWHRSAEAKEFFSRLQHKKKRRQFGLLEAPVMPPSISVDTVNYKVFISGKSAVGKTTLAARLAGLDVPRMHYETTGIETTVVFWPVKLRDSGRVLFFRFQFWDCGENSLRRFDHLLPSCKEQMDAILFLFSFVDHASFVDLSSQIARGTGASDNIVKVVVGTKALGLDSFPRFDLFMHTDVTEEEVRSFQAASGIPVFRVGGDVCGGWGEVAPLLNALAELLWHQDRLAAGKMPPQPSSRGETGDLAGC